MAQRFDDASRQQAEAYLASQNKFSGWKDNQGLGGAFDAIDQAKAQDEQRKIDAQNFRPVQSAADFDALAANVKAQPAPAEGMQLASDVVQQQPEEVPAAQAYDQANGIEQAYEMQQIGLYNATKAGAEKAAAEAGYLRQQEKELQRLEAERVVNEQRRQEAMQAEEQKLQKSIEEFGSLRVDPGRYWSERSTGQKVVTAIGLALGAYGNTSGTNRSMEVLQNAINQDIEAQKAEIGRKGEAINAQKNLYSQIRARFDDERQADAATKAAVIQNTQLKLQEIASRYKAPEIQANAQLMFGQLEAQKQQELMKFRQTSMARFVSAQAQQNPNDIDPNMLPEKDRERFVPGYGLALTTKGADEMKQAALDADNAKSGIKELLALSEKPLSSVTPAERARAETLAGVLKGNLRTFLVGPGAVSESERALLDSIVANPTAIFSLDAKNKASLNTLMGSIDRSLDNRAKFNGLRSKSAVRESLGVAPPVTYGKK